MAPQDPIEYPVTETIPGDDGDTIIGYPPDVDEDVSTDEIPPEELAPTLPGF